MRKAKYYVSVHGACRHREILSHIGPASAVSAVLQRLGIPFPLGRGEPTTDPYRASRWQTRDHIIFAYEVRDDAPLGVGPGYGASVPYKYGIKGSGKARAACKLPPDTTSAIRHFNFNKYRVSFHAHNMPSTHNIVVEAIGPWTAVKRAARQEELPTPSLETRRPTLDPFHGTCFDLEDGSWVFAYEVGPDGMLVRGDAGAQARTRTARRFAFEEESDTTHRGRELPPDAAAEIQHLSDKVLELQREVQRLTTERDAAERRYEREHRLYNEYHNNVSPQISQQRAEIRSLAERLDRKRRRNNELNSRIAQAQLALDPNRLAT